jgi:diguanylate cyclase (GGDEF)-like protein
MQRKTDENTSNLDWSMTALESQQEAPGMQKRAVVTSCDASIRKWSTKWLEQVGFQVELAGDVPETLSRIESEMPDVVLADAALTDRGDDGLCGALRRRRIEVPVLALCSGSREATQAFDAGCSDIVLKPVNWQLLSRRVELLVANHAVARERNRLRVLLEDARTSVETTRQKLQQLTTNDPLTGLPNRAAFNQMLAGALNCACSQVAVLFVDLDRFQLINRSLGRDVGDQLLRRVARRLADALRGHGLIARHRPGPATSALARLSGDEFTLMISNLSGPREALSIARRIGAALSEGFTVDGDEVALSATVGVALSPVHGDHAELLIQHAELAMNEAKRQGAGLVRFYKESMDAGTERSRLIESLLRKALRNEELEVHYQPLLDFAGQQVVGAEALLRWQHPELGPVSPAEFVPIAEQSGMMVDLGQWVLRRACRQLREWIDQGLAPIRMAINISRRQLVDADFAATVKQVLEETDLDPALLELELSERGVLRDEPALRRQLEELKAMGVRLAVDDFGTGDSAIAYLKRFPLDSLKIDRSYISGVARGEDDAAIASAMIAMAHKLHLEVVAEGVEDRNQLDFLSGCACDTYQGFLFSPAVPAAAFPALLESRDPNLGESWALVSESTS